MQKETSLFIKNKINELRKKDSINFFTNYFLTPLDDEIFCVHNENAIVFLQPEYDFYRMYYTYTNLEFFGVLLKEIEPDMAISLEIIQKNELDKNLKNILLNRFVFDTSFIKMQLLKFKETEKYTAITNKNIQYAEKSDAEIIYKELHKAFYQYSSHLPDLNKIMNYIYEKQIVVKRDANNKIDAFIIYIISGKQCNLDQIINISKRKNIVSNLINDFYVDIANKNIINIYLWVDSINNTHAKSVYEHYGYKPTELYNHIFITKGLKSKRENKMYYISKLFS